MVSSALSVTSSSNLLKMKANAIILRFNIVIQNCKKAAVKTKIYMYMHANGYALMYIFLNINMYILLLSQNKLFLLCLRGLIFSPWFSEQNIPLSLTTNVFLILTNMFDLYEGGILKAHFVIQLLGEK